VRANVKAELPLAPPGMGYLVIVRGPLGVGKSVVARRLARRLGGRYISIDEILEHHALEEWSHGYISLRSFLRANELAARLARTALRRGTPAVVDGNFYYRRQVDDLARRLRVPWLVFSLHAPLRECLRRDARRTPSFGAGAVRAVFHKVARVAVGQPVGATRPVGPIVTELAAAAGRLRAGRRNRRARRP
jgi:predicted kinase